MPIYTNMYVNAYAYISAYVNTYTVFELPGGLGGLNPLPHLADPPTSGRNSTPGGRVSTPLPKFCWSWYAAWFTLPSNAVLKISTVWWFECYNYFNSYWRLGVSSPRLSVKFVLRTWICNNVKKQICFCHC